MATLTKPTTPGFRSVKARFVKVKASAVSTFTLQTQTTLWSGERWEFEISLPSMTKEQADPWLTLLINMLKNDDVFVLDVSRYIPAAFGTSKTVRLQGNISEWDIDVIKRVGLTFVVEEVRS